MKLVRVPDVIKAVDNHTNETERLDDDISVILEDVKPALDLSELCDMLHNLECAITIGNAFKAIDIIRKIQEILGISEDKA